MNMATCHPTRPVHARGICGSCYSRAYKNGTLAEFTRPPLAETKRCVCGRVIAANTKRCSECHLLSLVPQWFCDCDSTEVDGLGQCARCGRVSRARIEASLGLLVA